MLLKFEIIWIRTSQIMRLQNDVIFLKYPVYYLYITKIVIMFINMQPQH